MRVEEIRGRDDYTRLSDISAEYLKRVVASEDRRFYYHLGVDPIAITRAVVHNLRAGRLIEGGSTITQQLAKNMFFSEERTCSRKVAEVLAALALERALTKNDILELYCNITYFGSGCYGIAAAADYYYGVAPAALDAAEAAALVHTLPAPNVLNPQLAA
ncbi:MAG: biosynthetic peptidoglycan transglycosylase [Oscillospiraceae bacterium]|nr:biosynthetic peptidoglycan transglycosylase [Oscillospiraceae bacterium]